MAADRFSPRWVWLAGSALMLLALGYHALSYYDYARPGHARDLGLRWREEQYVYRGVNPYDVYYANSPHQDWHRLAHRPEALAPDLGWLGSIPNYPPWYYGWAALLFWPSSWTFLCVAYTLVNLAGMAAIAAWVWREAAEKPAAWRFFLVAATLAVSSFTTCLDIGQAAIFTTAALVLALQSEKRPVAAGIFLAVAAMKPSTSAFNFVVFLWRRRFAAVAVSGLILALGCVAAWIMTATPPWVMLAQMSTGAGLELSIDGQGPIPMLAAAGLDPRLLTLGMPAVCFLAGLAALAVAEGDLATQFAIACVVNRLAFHHSIYDNVMVLFLLVALGKRAFAPFRPLAAAGFTLVGISLWLPGYVVYHVGFVMPILTAIWVLGVVLVARPLQSPRL